MQKNKYLIKMIINKRMNRVEMLKNILLATQISISKYLIHTTTKTNKSLLMITNKKLFQLDKIINIKIRLITNK